MVNDGMKFAISGINICLLIAYNGYVFTGIIMLWLKVLGRARWPVANLLWYWAKWPALISVFFNPICGLLTTGKVSPWEILNFIVSAYIWWTYRNIGDDDDHKKLKKKLKEKVHAVSGKLVVVPEPA